MREATHSQNIFNSDLRSNNITNVRGVFFDNERQKYLTRIMINGQHKFLGRFNTIEEAIEVRRKAEIKYFGEFANNSN